MRFEAVLGAQPQAQIRAAWAALGTASEEGWTMMVLSPREGEPLYLHLTVEGATGLYGGPLHREEKAIAERLAAQGWQLLG